MICRTIIVTSFCCYVSLVGAGEIVLDKTIHAHGSSAADQRNRAQEYFPDVGAVSGVPVDEGDSLFPQHGADSLPEGVSRGGVSSPGRDAVRTDNALPVGSLYDKADDNLSKARAYMKNSNPSQAVATLPVVTCENVNNVSGRIGDDTLSGSIITVIQNGKQIKARCR